MWLRAAGLPLAALGLWACGQAPPSLPPNDFLKSALEGRWHYSTELIDPPASIFSLVTKIAAVEEIQLAVQERYLLVVPAGAVPTFPANTDNILGAWPIVAHFDLLRSAEPSAGDGPLSETDQRFWYQREYLRLDDSRQLVAALAGWSPWPADVTVDPIGLYSPSGAESLRRNDAGGHEPLRSFDLTSGLFISSARLDQPGCAGSAEECSSLVLKVRHSFEKL